MYLMLSSILWSIYPALSAASPPLHLWHLPLTPSVLFSPSLHFLLLLLPHFIICFTHSLSIFYSIHSFIFCLITSLHLLRIPTLHLLYWSHSSSCPEVLLLHFYDEVPNHSTLSSTHSVNSSENETLLFHLSLSSSMETIQSSTSETPLACFEIPGWIEFTSTGVPRIRTQD